MNRRQPARTLLSLIQSSVLERVLRRPVSGVPLETPSIISGGPLWKSHWSRLAVASLVLCGSSCSSASKYVKDTFQPEPRPPVAAAEERSKNDPEVKHAYTASKKGQQQVDPLGHTETAAVSKAEKSAEKPKDVRALIAKGADPFGDSPIQQASNEQEAPVDQPFDKAFDQPFKKQLKDPFGEAVPNATGAIQHPSSAREPLSAQLTSATQACPPAAPCGARPFPGTEMAADEFVCDGGDKGEPVHYEGVNRAGLDVEDTIAEYRDETGKIRMKPSTQACVYAPRFGSVSSATLPEEGRQVDKLAGHQDQSVAGGLETKVVIDEKTQSDEPVGLAIRSRASGMNNKQVEDQLHQSLMAQNQVKLQNAYEDFRFLREGQFDLADSAVIELGVNAAVEWADGRRPIIVAKDEGGQVVQGRFTAQDYTGVEDKRTPGDLRLLKVADKASAHPGDIVTFTIRFDNVGGKDLSGVRVVDNLSPRLEYLEDSISSNLDGKIDVADNGFGGKLLTFEFDQPLKGQTGGYVSFQCRVR